jgi:ABC-type multidrug transport system permease subunit
MTMRSGTVEIDSPGGGGCGVWRSGWRRALLWRRWRDYRRQLAERGRGVEWTVGRWLIAAVVVAAMLAVVYVVLGAMGVVIPAFVVTIFWILFVAALGVVAVKFLLSLWSRGP